MRRLLLIAQREFKAVALRPRFLLLVLFPILIVALSFGSSLLAARSAPGAKGYAYLIVDSDGAIRQALTRHIERTNRMAQLVRFAQYLADNHLEPPRRWGRFPAVIGEAELRDAQSQGGIAAAIAELEPQLGKDTPRFTLGRPAFFEASIPSRLGYGSSAEDFSAVVEGLMGHSVETAHGPRPLGLAAWFPKDGGAPRIYMTDNALPLYRQLLDTVMRLRRAAQLAAQGMSETQIAKADPMFFDIEHAYPPATGSVSSMTLKRGVGLVLCYIIYIVIVMTGGLLLQATMEEKSGRLLESLLSIVTPGEILGGKLLAMAGVALLLAVVWSSMGLAVLSQLPAAIRQPAYEMLSAVGTPGAMVRLIFCFVTGYLVMAIPFLTIGAMCETVQDAQPFQIPLICLILPLIYVMASAVSNPESHMLSYLSWVPFYAPFAMTARLGEAVPWSQQLGSSLLLLAFLALEYRFMGRVFRAVLLRSGQTPNWREVIRLGFS